MTTITIRADYEEAAREKLAKLQKKAAGYGQVITVHFAEPVGVERHTTNWLHERVTYTEWYIDVTVEGEAPRIGDHTLMARLTREAGGVLVDKVPGIADSVGELGRAWAGNCEHCGHDRQRTHGFIVRTGEQMLVVGRTCLRDYLGIDTPEKALWIFQFARTLDNFSGEDDDGWGMAGARDWSSITRELLAATSGAIDLWGWAPKSGGHDMRDTTAGRVALLRKPAAYVCQRTEKPLIDALREELRTNAAKHYDRADAVIVWGGEIEPGKSDYLHNLKLLLACSWVKENRAGYICSAVPAYERALGKKLEAERRAKGEAEQPSSFVGEAGERITVEATVDQIRAMPADQFGDTSLYIFRTAAGAKLSWMTAAGSTNVTGLGRGDRIKLTGRVRKHVEFNGVKETRLSRCNVQKLEAAA